jgi:hypothetical protein
MLRAHGLILKVVHTHRYQLHRPRPHHPRRAPSRETSQPRTTRPTRRLIQERKRGRIGTSFPSLALLRFGLVFCSLRLARQMIGSSPWSFPVPAFERGILYLSIQLGLAQSIGHYKFFPTLFSCDVRPGSLPLGRRCQPFLVGIGLVFFRLPLGRVAGTIRFAHVTLRSAFGQLIDLRHECRIRDE